MNPRCYELAAFQAGELDDVNAEAMRRHIGECQRCQRDLGQLILEETVTHPKGRRIRPVRGLLFAKEGRRRLAVAGVALAAAAALLLVLVVIPRDDDRPSQPLPSPLAAVLAPKRSIEMRLGGADGYRPYDVQRAGPSTREDIPHGVLADLEQRGDAAALFAAHILRRDFEESAARALERVPAGPDHDSDQAALDLATGRPEAALGHAAAALARAPEHGRALWNAAVARGRMRLPLAAASLFERVAKLGEPGWSDEARAEATRLRDSWRRQDDAWQQTSDAADRLRLLRTPVAIETARRHPDVVRDALHDALRAASPDEASRLIPLADAIDEVHGTRSLGEIARQAARNPRGRAPVAAAYAGLLAESAPDSRIRPGGERWHALAQQARDAGLADLELGALGHAVFPEAGAAPAASAELDERLRESTDPWLHAWAAWNLAWRLLYLDRRFGAAQRLLLDAFTACPKERLPVRCARLAGSLAASFGALGREDLARRQLETAFQLAAPAQDSRLDRQLLHYASEIAVGRDPDAADPVALTDAYKAEQLLRRPECRAELFRLDYLASAALDLNRVVEAHRYSDEADELGRGRCAAVGPRVNGSLPRARLLQHDGGEDLVARVRADVAALRARPSTGEKAQADLIEGRLLIERNRDEGEALLRRAIAAAAGEPDDVLVRAAGYESFTVLVLDAGRRRDFAGAFALLLEAEGRSIPPGHCTLGVAGEDRLLVVARGTGSAIEGEYRSIPSGSRIAPVPLIVSARQKALLAGCPVVDVHARGVYYGLPRLLPRDLAWRYMSPVVRAQRAAVAGPRLVVTEVEPPAALDLPVLRGTTDEAGANVLRGGAATPRRVLAEMANAAVVEIHAHGVVDALDPNDASLALSPDADGDYALTADRVRGATLRRSPLVLLAACHGARKPHGEQRWGLADAFLAAGARSVVASTGTVPDADLSARLAAVTAGASAGGSAAEAVRRVRLAHPKDIWLDDIIVFE
jgi:cellulose synthase operon protein C